MESQVDVGDGTDAEALLVLRPEGEFRKQGEAQTAFHQVSDHQRVVAVDGMGHGISTLMALNILKDMDLGPLDSFQSTHLQLEAMKLAFADAQKYVAGPIGFGRGEIIWRNEEGVLCGACEPRTDGHVAVW